MPESTSKWISSKNAEIHFEVDFVTKKNRKNSKQKKNKKRPQTCLGAEGGEPMWRHSAALANARRRRGPCCISELLMPEAIHWRAPNT